mmetsp:Transcript_17146/g.35208  ORF Transcript_17146/g.35208 Transcript_17146/m.35208 type:complete len:267 (-) Transcript_17146:138-938(-)
MASYFLPSFHWQSTSSPISNTRSIASPVSTMGACVARGMRERRVRPSRAVSLSPSGDSDTWGGGGGGGGGRGEGTGEDGGEEEVGDVERLPRTPAALPAVAGLDSVRLAAGDPGAPVSGGGGGKDDAGERGWCADPAPCCFVGFGLRGCTSPFGVLGLIPGPAAAPAADPFFCALSAARKFSAAGGGAAPEEDDNFALLAGRPGPADSRPRSEPVDDPPLMDRLVGRGEIPSPGGIGALRMARPRPRGMMGAFRPFGVVCCPGPWW